MSPALQAKLLRVLQEREFERVGDGHTIKVDVRVIAATNTDLARLVGEGAFREDLYYRLAVIPIQLPPLRERKEDIPLLVQHFLDRFCRELPQPARTAAPRDAIGMAQGKDQPQAGAAPPFQMTVSQQAMRRLMAYSWPGNVRQLENVIERAVALSAGRTQIDVADLSPEVQQAAPCEVPVESILAGGRAGLPDLHRPYRARRHPPVAGTDARQQGRGGAALGLKRTDAGREG